MRQDVQVHQAKSGLPVLIVRGCATASSVDPMAEAERWFKLIEPQIRDLPETARIGVLGLGSGYHLDVLSRETKNQIIVFDSDPALAASRDWFADRFPAHVSLKFVDVEAGAASFLSDDDVRTFISNRIVLLRHKPSFLRDQRGLTTLGNWLTGRDRMSLNAHLQSRAEFSALVDCDRQNGDWLLSVKDLSRLWKVEAEVSEQRRMFRILEELVR